MKGFDLWVWWNSLIPSWIHTLAVESAGEIRPSPWTTDPRAHTTFWAVYKHHLIFSTTCPVPLRLVVRTRSDRFRGQSRPLPQDKVARVFAFFFLGPKNLWNLSQVPVRFGRWLNKEVFATQRDSEGNCIDILLLACLHKLYIWHRGGGTEHNHNTIKQHRQSLPLSNVSTC